MDRLWTPWRFEYISKLDQATSCVFCRFSGREHAMPRISCFSAAENAFVILNLFPYTSGHLLVVANRHISSLSDADAEELHEIID